MSDAREIGMGLLRGYDSTDLMWERVYGNETEEIEDDED